MSLLGYFVVLPSAAQVKFFNLHLVNTGKCCHFKF